MGDNSSRPLHVKPLAQGPGTVTVQLETGYGAFPLNSSVAQLSIAKVWGSAESEVFHRLLPYSPCGISIYL